MSKSICNSKAFYGPYSIGLWKISTNFPSQQYKITFPQILTNIIYTFWPRFKWKLCCMVVSIWHFFLWLPVRFHVWGCVCVCVSVCERQRQKEMERELVCEFAPQSSLFSIDFSVFYLENVFDINEIKHLSLNNFYNFS